MNAQLFAFQMITLGGDAELELVDSLDPFTEGIVFSVRPPKKSWKNISNLSGGEKTLSSLGKNHALKKYDQFALNTSCFWGKYRIKYYPQLCNFTNFLLQN